MAINPTSSHSTAPQWVENERIMKTVASGTLSLSAGAVVGSALVFTAAPVAASCALVAALASAVTSLYLLRKSYWNDPAFIERKAAALAHKPYAEIVKDLGWKEVTHYRVISKATLAEKCFEAAKSLPYLEIERRFSDAIQEGLLPKTWLSQKCIEAVSTLPYPIIRRDFSPAIQTGILPRQSIAEILLQQKEKRSFYDWFSFHGGHQTWTIFTDRILAPELFRNEVINEVSSFGSIAVLSRYGFGVLENRILLPNHIAPRLGQELYYLPFSQIMGLFKEPYNLLSYGLVSKDVLRAKAIQELSSTGMSLQDIVKKFSWEIFKSGLLLPEDSMVPPLVRAFLYSNTFCNLSDTTPIFDPAYRLIPAGLKQTIPLLLAQKSQATQSYESTVRLLDETYRTEEARALQDHKRACSQEDRRYSDACIYINNLRQLESRRFYTAGHHPIDSPSYYEHRRMMTVFDAQLAAANATHNQTISSNTAHYERQLAAIKQARDLGKRQALSELEYRKTLINQQFAQQTASFP